MSDPKTLSVAFNGSNTYFKPPQTPKKKQCLHTSGISTKYSYKENKLKDKQREKQVDKMFMLSHQNPYITFPANELSQKQILIELIQEGRQSPCKIKLSQYHIEIQRDSIQHSFPLHYEQKSFLKVIVSGYSMLEFRIVVTIIKGRIKKSLVNTEEGQFYEINPFQLIEEAKRVREIKMESFKLPKPAKKKMNFSFNLVCSLVPEQPDVSFDKCRTQRFTKCKAETPKLNKMRQKMHTPTQSSKQIESMFRTRLSSQCCNTSPLSVPLLNQ